jgi:transcriptional regulator with XRE-family HTH domain
MSAAELARRAGLSSVKMIERGKSLSPRIGHLEGIARVLGCTVAELFAEPKPKARKRAA